LVTYKLNKDILQQTDDIFFIDAWVVTGGTYAGVMKEVGDAVDKRRYKNTKTPSKVQCIGIASWYYTTGMLF
jgi:hypothetical protein